MHAQRTGWGREAPGRETDYDHDSSTGSRIRACFWQNYTTGSQTTTGGNIQSVPAVTWEPPPPPPTTPDRPGRSVPPSSPTRKKSSLHGLINGTVGLVVLIIIIAAGAGCGTTSTNGASVAPTTTPTTKAPTSPPSTRVQPGPATTPATRPPVTTVPLPATTPPASPATSTALAGLATLPVKGRAPLTGYSRAQFGPAWTDDVSVAGGHNGCDTRNDILRRDLTNVVIKPGTHGCTVASGVLHDPYTNAVMAFTRGETHECSGSNRPRRRSRRRLANGGAAVEPARSHQHGQRPARTARRLGGPPTSKKVMPTRPAGYQPTKPSAARTWP